MITFTDYLNIVNEDATADIAALQAKISAIQQRLNQATAPLQRQMQQMQAMLAQKQKQAQSEAKTQQRASQTAVPGVQQPGNIAASTAPIQ